MKNIGRIVVICGMLALGIALPARGQVALNTNTSPPTLTGPGIDLLKYLGTATNWVVAPFMTYDTANHQYGGGLAGVINITSTLGTMLRVDYLGSEFYQVSAGLQLQAPISVGSNFMITPFGFSTIATPLSGAGSQNGTVQGVFGSGLDFKFPNLSSHFSMAFDAEYWTARPGGKAGLQWRFSPLVWRF